MTYMDLTGLAPDTPPDSEFKANCSLKDNEELPEDFDEQTLCGWTETEPVALSAD